MTTTATTTFDPEKPSDNIFGNHANQRFDLILADPPWRYRNKHPRFNPKYQTMTIKEIKEMPIAESLAAKNAILFLWATSPLLPEALAVIDAWGFTYKTCFLQWIKTTKKPPQSRRPRIGGGYYTRSCCEFLLMGVRGKVKPSVWVFDHSTPSVLFAPLRGHSRKPLEVYDIIAKLFGSERSRIELFARGAQASGWSAWGNQLQDSPSATTTTTTTTTATVSVSVDVDVDVRDEFLVVVMQKGESSIGSTCNEDEHEHEHEFLVIIQPRKTRKRRRREEEEEEEGGRGGRAMIKNDDNDDDRIETKRPRHG